MDPQKVLAYYSRRVNEIVESIREIVNIESPSHDREQSRILTDWILEKLRATGVELSIERVEVPDGVHLTARAFGTTGSPTLLLGHTDTVHPVGTNSKNPTRVEAGKLYGCGVFDMKANIILMLEVLRFFKLNGITPADPIAIFLSCDEEVGSFSGRPLLEQVAAECGRCLVFEPSAEGKVKTGRKGTGVYKITAHGRSAHAGLEPEKGANAVEELARQLTRIHALSRRELGTTVNVCTFRGGTTSNVIPDKAECEVDVRFNTKEEAKRVDLAIRSLAPMGDGLTIEVTGGINRPPLERNEAVARYFETARSTAAEFGYELGETQVGGASDGNFVAALGIPILDGLGLSGAGAHMLSEHIFIDDIPQRATLLTLLLSRSS